MTKLWSEVGRGGLVGGTRVLNPRRRFSFRWILVRTDPVSIRRLNNRINLVTWRRTACVCRTYAKIVQRKVRFLLVNYRRITNARRSREKCVTVSRLILFDNEIESNAPLRAVRVGSCTQRVSVTR